MLVTAFNGAQAVFEAVSPSLSSLSPLSFTGREVSRTYPQLVKVHGRSQPKPVIVLVMDISVALAHLACDGLNAHLDEGLNVSHPYSLFMLLEFSPSTRGAPHVGGGAGAVSAHQLMEQPIPDCEKGSQISLFNSGCWRLG